MSAKNACMSAFPCEQHETQEGNWNQTFEPGMTLRDYFAAHAPAEPQSWFEPTMPSGSPNDYFKERSIQWPYAWADEQLKEREK